MINEETKTLLREALSRRAEGAAHNPLRESYAALVEKHGKTTFKELLTTTGSIALPTMTAAKVLLNLTTFRNFQEACLYARASPGSGKIVTGQVLTSKAPTKPTEGTGYTSSDPTVDGYSITLAEIGDSIFVSQFLATQSAYSVVEQIALAQADTIRAGILDGCVDALVGARTGVNTKTVGTKADGVEADYTFATVDLAIGECILDAHIPDFLLTAPDKFRTCVVTDYDKKLFYGSLSDYMLQGRMPVVLGLDVYAEPYYEAATGQTWTADGSDYAIVGKKQVSCVWSDTDPVPETEIWRDGKKSGWDVISRIYGGADDGAPTSICLISHAA
jgi:hypothetical protein